MTILSPSTLTAPGARFLSTNIRQALRTWKLNGFRYKAEHVVTGALYQIEQKQLWWSAEIFKYFPWNCVTAAHVLIIQ